MKTLLYKGAILCATFLLLGVGFSQVHAQPSLATHTATVTVYKDSVLWEDCDKTFTLKLETDEDVTHTLSGANGVFTAVVSSGTWKIYDGDTYIGKVVLLDEDTNTSLEYFTINFSGGVQGFYDNISIISGAVVLAGGRLWLHSPPFTGPENYSYLWSGAGTNGETTNDIVIENLHCTVNAVLTITQTDYVVYLQLTKDGEQWYDSGKIFTLKKADDESIVLTMETMGVYFTASVAVTSPRIWKVYDGDVYTGAWFNLADFNHWLTLNYYTVQFSVIGADGTSGSTISATYDGKPTESGTAVLGGKDLSIAVNSTFNLHVTFNQQGDKDLSIAVNGTSVAYTLNNLATATTITIGLEAISPTVCDTIVITVTDTVYITTPLNPTATAKVEQTKISVYPNPVANGQLTIENEQWEAGEAIEIYSMSGALVTTYKTTGEKTSVNVLPLPNGTYLLKVGRYTAKFVKQ
jgi:hypothetical protein